MKIKELIKDPKHWFGWILSAGLISLALNGLNMIREGFLWIILSSLIILIVVVVVDTFKHLVRLQ